MLLLTAEGDVAILFIKTPFFGGFRYRESHGIHNPFPINAGKQGRAGAHRTGAP